jgi:predicted DNA-binding transcriptional regulator YafY
MPNYGNYYIGIRLLLLKEYLQANAGPRRPIKRRELEAYLAEQGFPVEKKTLYADFAVLDDVFGLHLEYDQHSKGWILKNPPFEPRELRMLVDGVQSAKFITKEEARKITDKIKRLAGKDTVATLNRQTYVADRVRNQNENVVSEADRLHQAIAEDSQISFRYFHYSPDKSNPRNYSYDGKRITVSPYALLWNNGNYYLYAYDGKKFRYYRVDRMERISQPLIQKREGKDLFKVYLTAFHLTRRVIKICGTESRFKSEKAVPSESYKRFRRGEFRLASSAYLSSLFTESIYYLFYSRNIVVL